MAKLTVFGYISLQPSQKRKKKEKKKHCIFYSEKDFSFLTYFKLYFEFRIHQCKTSNNEGIKSL